jgi:hypothetical protein
MTMEQGYFEDGVWWKLPPYKVKSYTILLGAS